MERQAQCELAAIRDTRSALAVQVIRSACNWLVVNADSLLNEQNRPYYLCLVQNLSGAQSDAATQAIVSACRTANPLRSRKTPAAAVRARSTPPEGLGY